MNSYSLALFIHLVSLMLIAAASGLSMYVALQLRKAETVDGALAFSRVMARVAPAYAIGTIGLLFSGAWMATAAAMWPMPWLGVAIIGFILIVVLGAGVQERYGRALRNELQSAGFSDKARQLTRNRVAWSARMAGEMLLLAVVFIMAVKPAAMAAVSALVVAVIIGLLLAAVVSRRDPVSEIEAVS